jgi:transcriptional regulator with XRE-family HTH domain
MLKGFGFLQNYLNSKNITLAELAEKLGVTAQAVNNWKTSNEIPTKRVSDIVKFFSFTNGEVDLLLGVDPLEFEYRTVSGQEINKNRVSASIRFRTEIIYERFFTDHEQDNSYDLSGLKAKIEKAGADFKAIADAFRAEFTIPNYRPLSYMDLKVLTDRLAVRSYYLPFKAIGLVVEGENKQSAILFNKNSKFVALLDSDRMVDEAHFDRIHELMHVIFNGIKHGLSESDHERLLDKITGELIYPSQYILERFFNGDPQSRPIKDTGLLSQKFWEDTLNFDFSISPKGLAKAMVDSGFITQGADLYKYLVNDLHSDFRSKCISISKLGAIDFDFSDRQALLDFYESINKPLESSRYPLFVKVKSDLLSGVLSVSDFADTFNLKLEDALFIEAIWSGENTNDESK